MSIAFADPVILKIRATKEDVEKYVHGQTPLLRLLRSVKEDSSLLNEIVSPVMEIVGGMCVISPNPLCHADLVSGSF